MSFFISGVAGSNARTCRRPRGTRGHAALRDVASSMIRMGVQQCTVQLYPQGLGNPAQTVEAKVFTTIGVFAIQGSLPPSIDFGRILTGLTCTQPAG